MRYLIDKLEERQTGRKLPEEPVPSVSLASLKTGEQRLAGFGYSNEYQLRATIGVNFWATDAEKRRIREDAEKLLVRAVFADFLSDLNKLRMLAHNRRYGAILDILDVMESRILK